MISERFPKNALYSHKDHSKFLGIVRFLNDLKLKSQRYNNGIFANKVKRRKSESIVLSAFG